MRKSYSVLITNPKKVGDKCHLIVDDKRCKNGVRLIPAIITEINDTQIIIDNKVIFKQPISGSKGQHL